MHLCKSAVPSCVKVPGMCVKVPAHHLIHGAPAARPATDLFASQRRRATVGGRAACAARPSFASPAPSPHAASLRRSTCLRDGGRPPASCWAVAAEKSCSTQLTARRRSSARRVARPMRAASLAFLSPSLRPASSPCCFLCFALAGGAGDEQNQVARTARTAAKRYRSSSARCAWPRLRRARLHAASPAAPRCRAC